MSESIQGLSDGLAAAVSASSAAVVAINARRKFTSSGLHVGDGRIVTAAHTIRREDDIQVTLPDGQAAEATLVGGDGATDLALLRIEGASLPVLENAAVDGLKAGQLVLAVARSPEDGVGTSLGVVSSVSGAWRTWRGGSVENFIQPDLRLYPGFSGGPLVDVSGRAIGVNTSGLSRHMAITLPMATVARIVDELSSRGRVGRAYIGAGLQPVGIPPRLREHAESGVIVLSVEPDGPADRAGIMLGDVLIGFDGKPISDTEDLLEHLSATAVGTRVTLRILRAGAVQTVEVETGERP